MEKTATYVRKYICTLSKDSQIILSFLLVQNKQVTARKVKMKCRAAKTEEAASPVSKREGRSVTNVVKKSRIRRTGST